MKFCKIKKWISTLKKYIYALYLAYKDPRVPLVAKILIASVIAYAISPIDLIPDFIPIIGYLDDFILLPIGIWISIKIIPNEIWRACQEITENMGKIKLSQYYNHLIAIVILSIWFLILFFFLNLLFNKP